MQAQSWFNRAHVEQSKQAPGQLERKIRQEKSHFYPIPFLKVYIMIFIAGLILIKRLCWYFSGLIYQKYANKIMADLNLDLAKQAFKLKNLF